MSIADTHTVGPRERRRRARSGFAAATAIALGLLAPLAAMPAQAAELDTVATSFEIDGNMTVEATQDWDNVNELRLTDFCVEEPGDENPPDPSASAESQTIHDYPWRVGEAPVNTKDDLCSAGLATETVDGDTILYLYWTRAPQGTGDLSVFYELEGGPEGREGDVLLEFNVAPNGDTTVVAWIWDAEAGAFVQSETALDFDAEIGPNPDYTDAEADTFGEAAINLTTSGLLPEDECVTFTTGDLVTRTGNSLPANSILQDFILTGSNGLVLSNCGTLTLDKVVRNDHGGTATGADFYLVASRQSDAEPSIAGRDTNSGVGSTLTAAVLPGAYSLDETTELTTYVEGTWTCTIGATGVPVVDGVVTMPPGAGVRMVCTIVNDDRPATLTLVKRVVNDDGGTLGDGDFTLKAQIGSTLLSGVEGAPAITNATVSAGSYTIGEDPVAGYTMTGVACWTDSMRTTPVAVSTTNVITLANAGSAYCEITNDDVPARLTLVKNVISDGGGTLTDAAFTLTATGPTTLSGVEGSAAVTNREVLPGTYTVGEVTVSGYGMTGVQCWTDATRATAVTVAAGGRITLVLGASAFCEVTNDDIDIAASAGELDAVKSVWERSGSDWAASDGRVSFGDTVQYRIVLGSSEGDSTNVVVVDQLQDGLTSSGPATCSVTCTATYDAATGTHRVVIAMIAEDSSATITFTATVPAAPSQAAGTTVTSTFDNFAAYESDQQGRKDTNIVTVTASHTLADKPAAVDDVRAPRPILPQTGAEPPMELIGIALGMLAAGSLLLLGRRRPDREA